MPDPRASVLLATCADLPQGDPDDAHLTAALAAAGVTARWAVWSDPQQRWDEEVVVLRSTWDYHSRLEEFLIWARGVARLHNPAVVVAWNTDKTYLGELAAAGVPTVPSRFVAPGEQVELPASGEFVIKPSVGAGSRGAGRFSAGSGAAAREHLAALHAAGRTAVVQPFLTGVDTAGETALLFAAGRFSHAIRKGPMLTADAAHPVAGASLFVPENITARQPGDDELAVGQRAVDFVRERFDGEPLYARVDLLPTEDGPVVTELELTEPSLFLGHDTEAARRFAAAIADVT